MNDVTERLVTAVKGHVARALDSLNPRFAALEERVAALEQQEKSFRYRGVFQRADEYAQHNLVTHDGSMWIAVRNEPGVPGESDGWQLTVKRGRDGKDAR